jgi:probable HAF family extracellular repeat protein
LGALVLAWMATAGWSQSLTWLGTLPGGTYSVAYGVSADGSVVVGVADNASGDDRAFRWTASGGMQDLGTLPAVHIVSAMAFQLMAPWSSAVADNAARDDRAFRWTASGGMQYLGRLGGI